MAKKTDAFAGSGGETIIGSTVKLKGNLNTDGDIAIDGRMVGNIKSGGNVVIGVNAHVAGDVSASSIVVGGRLDGHVKVQDTATVQSTGQVHGNIDCVRLEVALGGLFIGISRMKAVEAKELADRELTGDN